MMNNILYFDTSDINQTEYFKKINEVLAVVIENKMADRGAGHCVSMSSMLSSLLTQNGINNKVVECQLALTNVKKNGLKFIGYDSPLKNNIVDTHVVVITETKVPLLIDVSIAHHLPEDYKIIVSRTLKVKGDVLVNVQNGIVKLLYEQKQKFNIAALHQTSILQRIETDMFFQRQINYLKYLNYIGIGLSVFSLINSLLLVFGVILDK